MKDVLKENGTPGVSLQQDHYRLQQQIERLRKLIGLRPEELISG